MNKMGASSVMCLRRASSEDHLFWSKGIYHLAIRCGAQRDRVDSMELMVDEAGVAVHSAGRRKDATADPCRDCPTTHDDKRLLLL